MGKGIKSRKFIVYITTTILCISTVFYTKTITPELINAYTVVSALYIGGNVAKAYMNKEK